MFLGFHTHFFFLLWKQRRGEREYNNYIIKYHTVFNNNQFITNYTGNIIRWCLALSYDNTKSKYILQSVHIIFISLQKTKYTGNLTYMYMENGTRQMKGVMSRPFCVSVHKHYVSICIDGNIYVCTHLELHFITDNYWFTSHKSLYEILAPKAYELLQNKAAWEKRSKTIMEYEIKNTSAK